MTRPDLNRPIVIPISKRELLPDVLSSNLRTLGITRRELEEYLSQI